jgi:hypothetical protein
MTSALLKEVVFMLSIGIQLFNCSVGSRVWRCQMDIQNT